MNLRDAYVTAIPLVEDFVFTALSVIVAAALVAGVVIAPDPSIAFAARKDPGDNPNFVVLYGAMADETGAAVAGATITVTSPNRVTQTVTTAPDGTFRFRFKEDGGPYTVTVTTTGPDGQPVTQSTTVNLTANSTWRMDVTYNSGGSGYTWGIALPIY